MARKTDIKADKALTPPDEQLYSNDALQVSSRVLPWGGSNMPRITGGITSLYYAGSSITPYGVDPKFRDWQLWQCVNNNSWLSSVVSNMVKRTFNAPYKIKAKNPNVVTHVELAHKFNTIFWEGDSTIEDSKGWADVGEQFVKSILTQDSPAILEILDSADNIDRDAEDFRIGFGGFRLWDSSQVIRKNDTKHPVAILYKPEGEQKEKQYKLHYTRVFSIVDMPSSKPELNGIGLCATSRALDFFGDLDNLTDTKNEYYGDGEPDQVWTLTSNAIPQVGDGSTFLDQVENKYRMARSNSATQKTARRLKLELPEGSSFNVDNARVLPDGFDESVVIENAMKGMASAFNTTLRFIWTITTRGLGDQSSADLDQEISESGFIAWFVGKVIRLTQKRILPLTLMIESEIKGDKQDKQLAETQAIITKSNAQRLADGVIDIRTYRQSELRTGAMTESEFIRLELEDGRLRDGKPVVDKFYDPKFADILTIANVNDPLDVTTNASPVMIDLLGDKAREVKRLRESITDDGRRVSERDRLTIAHTALMRLQSLYMERLESLEQENEDTRPEQDEGEQIEDKARVKKKRFHFLEGLLLFSNDDGVKKAINRHLEIRNVYANLDLLHSKMDSELEPLSYRYTQKLIDRDTYISNLNSIDTVDDDLTKKKATKAVNDDLDLYQQKLETILQGVNNGDIDEDEAQERISALASAMLIIAFLLGKREREDRLTPTEAALMRGARLILNNGGITQDNFTAEQLARFNEGLAIINDDTLKADAFTADELQLLNEQTAINQEASGGVVEWALNLSPVLVGLGLVGSEFDAELVRRINERVVKWRNKASVFVDVGRVAVRPTQLFQWRIGSTKESCDTCLFYNGQIKTGFEWFRLAVTQGIYPQSFSLACKGFNCLCSLVMVS